MQDDVAQALKDLPPSGSYLLEVGESLGGFYWTKGIKGYTFGFNKKYIKIAPEESEDFVKFIRFLARHMEAKINNADSTSC